MPVQADIVVSRSRGCEHTGRATSHLSRCAAQATAPAAFVSKSQVKRVGDGGNARSLQPMHAFELHRGGEEEQKRRQAAHRHTRGRRAVEQRAALLSNSSKCFGPRGTGDVSSEDLSQMV